MRFLKSLGRGLGSSVFKFSLLFMAIIAAVMMVFGTPDRLKQALGDSHIYKSGVDQLFDKAAQPTDRQNGESSPFDQQPVIDAAKTAVTPAFLQKTVEQVIDGIYGWLNQKTAQPEFQIDISQVKQRFTQSVGDYAVNRAQQLPACTPLQSRQLASSGIDALQISCRPAGFDINSLRDQVTQQINDAKDDNILKNSTITPDNLPKDDNGKTAVQTLAENGRKAPEAFHRLKVAPWVLGGLAVVSGGLVLLLYDERRRGIRNLSISMLGVGVIILLGVLVTSRVFDKLDSPTGPLAKRIDNQLGQPALAAAHSLANAVNHDLLIYGMIYVAVAVTALTILHFTQPKKPTAPDMPTKESTEAVGEKEASTNKKILIQ